MVGGNFTEEARDLREALVLEEALVAETSPILQKTADRKGLEPFRATKEPFLSLHTAGWRKHEIRCRWASGLVFSVHLWVSPEGERRHLKIVDSPLDSSGYIPLR